MNVSSIGVRNIWRNKTRTVLTIAAGAFFVLFFILLRTILWAWNVQAEYAAHDRLAPPEPPTRGSLGSSGARVAAGCDRR